RHDPVSALTIRARPLRLPVAVQGGPGPVLLDRHRSSSGLSHTSVLLNKSELEQPTPRVRRMSSTKSTFWEWRHDTSAQRRLRDLRGLWITQVVMWIPFSLTTADRKSTRLNS